MDERNQSLLNLKSRYFQHILAVSLPAAAVASAADDEDHHHHDTRTTPSKCAACCPPEVGEDHLLVEQAIGLLSPTEKDEIILQLHEKLRRMSDRVDEVIAFSERTVSGLEMAHQEATREREESEHRLLQELHRLKHCHPEVDELRAENARLREESERLRRQHLVALGKLSRGREPSDTRRSGVKQSWGREKHTGKK
ncbi:unnamed protein product [Ascophyllum nodosum]